MTQLPHGWMKARISEVTEPVANIKPEQQPNKEFRYIDISAIDNVRFAIRDLKRFKGANAPSRARRPIRTNDVLFSNVRTYLRNIAVVEEGSEAEICSTGFTVLRPNRAIEPRYLFQYVLTDEFIEKVTPKQTGTHYPATSDKVVLSEEIPLAPLNEQRRIVEKLEKLLSRVNAAQVRLATIPGILKRFRQSVLSAACSGKLTADWRKERPKIETASALLKRIRKERRTFTKSENHGSDPEYDLPESWLFVTIDELTDIQNGRAFPSKQYGQEGVRLLRPGNLHINGKVDWNCKNTACLPERWGRDYPGFLLRSGELLMNLTAQSLRDEFLGRVCIKTDSVPALLNQRIARFINHGADDLRPYLFVYFKSPQFRSYVNTLDTGSLIRHMHSKQVLSHVAPLPPFTEQREIVRRVDALFKTADALEARYHKAKSHVDKLTQSILAKAFRGELVPQDPTDEPASVLLERKPRTIGGTKHSSL